jgi:hypothetical protein
LSALVLDAGALIAFEREDRSIVARLQAAERDAIELRTTAIVLGQVWRDPTGRQARLARLLQRVQVRSIDEGLGRDAGVLLGRAGTNDPIDATVVLVASDGDIILTSDAVDIAHLASAAGRRVVIIAT